MNEGIFLSLNFEVYLYFTNIFIEWDAYEYLTSVSVLESDSDLEEPPPERQKTEDSQIQSETQSDEIENIAINNNTNTSNNSCVKCIACRHFSGKKSMFYLY
jgi:hypothetical protein